MAHEEALSFLTHAAAAVGRSATSLVSSLLPSPERGVTGITVSFKSLVMALFRQSLMRKRVEGLAGAGQPALTLSSHPLLEDR